MSNPSRRDARFPYRLNVVIKGSGAEQKAVTLDVSYRGLFVCTDAPPVLRQLISVQAVLPPKEERFASHGMTVFNRGLNDPSGLPPGVGIQFYAQTRDQSRLWDDFINRLRNGEISPHPIEVRKESIAAKAAAPIRRAHPRVQAVLAVRPRNLDELMLFYSRDISQGGMFLTTEKQVPEGSVLRLDVHHPDSDEVFPLEAVVKRLSNSPPGLGVQFTNLEEDERERFSDFISGIMAIDEVELVDEGDPRLA